MVMTTDIRFGIAGNREDPLDKSDSGTELSNGSASAVRIRITAASLATPETLVRMSGGKISWSPVLMLKVS